MSNSQLYLSIGVPIIMVLIGILFGQHWTKGINSRINQASAETNDRFNQASADTNARFGQIDSRIGQLESTVNAGFLQIQSDLKAFYRDLGRHDSDIANLKERKAG